MEEYKGRCAPSGKEKMHEQSYPHPKAQRAVRGAASI